MIDVLIFFSLIHWGVMVLFNKYELYLYIAKFGDKFKNGFFRSFLIDLAYCNFCLSHHVGFLVVLPIIYYYFCGWGEILLIYPFLGASFISIINKLSEK